MPRTLQQSHRRLKTGRIVLAIIELAKAGLAKIRKPESQAALGQTASAANRPRHRADRTAALSGRAVHRSRVPSPTAPRARSRRGLTRTAARAGALRNPAPGASSARGRAE